MSLTRDTKNSIKNPKHLVIFSVMQRLKNKECYKNGPGLCLHELISYKNVNVMSLGLKHLKTMSLKPNIL